MDEKEENTEKRRGGELKCNIHTYRQTDRQTYRPSDEVGCRGAFAPKNKELKGKYVLSLTLKSSIVQFHLITF